MWFHEQTMGKFQVIKTEQDLIWESYASVKETTSTPQNIDRVEQLQRIERQNGASAEELEMIQQVLDQLIATQSETIKKEAGKTKRLLDQIIGKFRR